MAIGFHLDDDWTDFETYDSPIGVSGSMREDIKRLSESDSLINGRPREDDEDPYPEE